MTGITCGDCINAEFTLTPTGRIKKNYSGRCLKSAQLITIAKLSQAPCLSQIYVSAVGIWPDYQADDCKFYQDK